MDYYKLDLNELKLVKNEAHSAPHCEFVCLKLTPKEARDLEVDGDPSGKLMEALDEAQAGPFGNDKAVSFVVLRITSRSARAPARAPARLSWPVNQRPRSGLAGWKGGLVSHPEGAKLWN